MQQVLQRRAAASDAVRARRGTPRRFAYGPTSVERLDVYPTARPNAPVMVPEFATVMDVGLDGMVAQVRRAVAWVAANAQSFGGDPGRVYVGGHSSGGHLAGNVLVTDWVKDFGLPADVVKGGLCVSGMYDLRRCGCRRGRHARSATSPVSARRSSWRTPGTTRPSSSGRRANLPKR